MAERRLRQVLAFDATTVDLLEQRGFATVKALSSAPFAPSSIYCIL